MADPTRLPQNEGTLVVLDPTGRDLDDCLEVGVVVKQLGFTPDREPCARVRLNSGEQIEVTEIRYALPPRPVVRVVDIDTRLAEAEAEIRALAEGTHPAVSDDEPPGSGADPYGRPDPRTHPDYWTE